MNTDKMLIFCAPSGSGKTTITRKMLEIFPKLSLSVSAITRLPRANEINGVDYYFISTEEFKNKINNGEFLEWEEFYQGTLYGTLKSEISRLQSLNKIPIFDIDVKGAMNLKKMYGDSALVIYIKVPLDLLKERLLSRNTETKESFEMRIDRVKEEMKYESLADVVIQNINLEDAQNECQKVISNFLGIN